MPRTAIALALALAIPAASPAAPLYALGDLDQDSRITPVDVQMMAALTAGLPSEASCPAAGDLDGDGQLADDELDAIRRWAKAEGIALAVASIDPDTACDPERAVLDGHIAVRPGGQVRFSSPYSEAAPEVAALSEGWKADIERGHLVLTAPGQAAGQDHAWLIDADGFEFSVPLVLANEDEPKPETREERDAREEAEREERDRQRALDELRREMELVDNHRVPPLVGERTQPHAHNGQCPQRWQGKGCVALVLDWFEHVDHWPYDMDDTADALRAMGCTVYEDEPWFREMPDFHDVRVWNGREWTTEHRPVDPAAAAVSRAHNNAMNDLTRSNISAFLDEVRDGRDMVFMLVDTHGSGGGTCGSWSHDSVYANALQRSRILGRLYRASRYQSCGTIVIDKSCAGGLSPIAYDELSNGLTGTCAPGWAIDHDFHPTFDNTIVASPSAWDGGCHAIIDLDSVWALENRLEAEVNQRQKDGWGPARGYARMIASLANYARGEVAHYVDDGWPTCDSSHDRAGLQMN